MVRIWLIRGVALQQQKFDRRLRHDAAQALRACVGHRTTDAEVETELPQLARLLFAAGKAVHHAAQSADVAQRQDDFLQRAARVHDHRQLSFTGQPQLANEIIPLQRVVESRHVKIQPDLADADGRTGVQPRRQGLHMFRRMLRQVHRMQAEGGKQRAVFPAKLAYRGPAAQVNRRHDHGGHARRGGPLDHGDAIVGEGGGIQVYVSIDKRLHAELSCSGIRRVVSPDRRLVVRSEREDNVTRSS